MRLYRQARELLWILLLPLSWVWAITAKLRRRFYLESCRYRSKLKIICIGNVHSGGSGKTPIAIEVFHHFEMQNPVILSRGYRGISSRKGERVDPQQIKGFTLYGDEPWMLAKRLHCSVWIGKRRRSILKEIEGQGSPPVIMDDGFQHLSVMRAVDLVVINTEKDVESLYCLPFGELREPISSLCFCSAIILVGKEEAKFKRWEDLVAAVAPQRALFRARRIVEGMVQGDILSRLEPSEPLGAFCGIAEPSGFLEDIKSFSHVTHLKSFPDHHDYTHRDLDFLVAEKTRLGLHGFLTTDKDWFKVDFLFRERKEKLFSLRIRYELSNDFWYFLEERLERYDLSS